MNSHKVREVVRAIGDLMRAQDTLAASHRRADAGGRPDVWDESEAVNKHSHNVTNKLAELIADEVHTILTERQHRVSPYDPFYGDDKPCICGHPYYRHFDTYDDMAPVGCKYCLREPIEGFEKGVCPGFKEAT